MVFLDVEHHANLLPWRPGPHRCVAAAATVAATARRACEPTLRAAAVQRCSPSPARPTSPVRCCRSAQLAALAHRHGARIVVDAAQLAPHRRIDLAADGRRLRRLLRAQALRPVRRRRAGRAAATGSTPRRRTWPAAAPSATSGSTSRPRWAAGAAPARGRHPERPRRGRAAPGPPGRSQPWTRSTWPGHEDASGPASSTASRRDWRACTGRADSLRIFGRSDSRAPAPSAS